MVQKIFGEIFVGVDGFAHHPRAGVGNFEKFESGGNGGREIFQAVDRVNQVDDKVGLVFFKILGKEGVAGEKGGVDVHFPEIHGHHGSPGFDFGFGDILGLGREIFPLGIRKENSNALWRNKIHE